MIVVNYVVNDLIGKSIPSWVVMLSFMSPMLCVHSKFNRKLNVDRFIQKRKNCADTVFKFEKIEN